MVTREQAIGAERSSNAWTRNPEELFLDTRPQTPTSPVLEVSPLTPRNGLRNQSWPDMGEEQSGADLRNRESKSATAPHVAQLHDIKTNFQTNLGLPSKEAPFVGLPDAVYPLTQSLTGESETNPFRKPQTPLPVDLGRTHPIGLQPGTSSAFNEPSKNPWQTALDQAPSVNTLWVHPQPIRQPTPPNQDFESWAFQASPVDLDRPSNHDTGIAGLSLLEAGNESPAWGETALDYQAKDNHTPTRDPLGIVFKLEDPSSNLDDSIKGATPIIVTADRDVPSFCQPPPLPPRKLEAPSSTTSTTVARAQFPSVQPLRLPQSPQPPPLPLPPQTSLRRGEEDLNEMYQIKMINWHDSGAKGEKIRTSPILIQNQNGPCPLVALVNTLSLTTPVDTDTALVHVLNAREQVSLRLLIDVVFEELMSPVRARSDEALSDVSLLYGFLKSLHTGMNVNPLFVMSREQETGTVDHESPGTFEDTPEMRLYSTFSIPLIHGWLPAHQDPEYEAFKRQAASYEDVQNLLFREEELEDKLMGHVTAASGTLSNGDGGLSEQEQQLYQDILAISSFLVSNPTQLTKWGLEVIRANMSPGSFAILFRNDHFSTLYLHPVTLRLLTLVTDAGYASHPEVVWEELVDISGKFADFLSGDFRPVGGSGTAMNDHVAGGGAAVTSPGTLKDNEWPALSSRGATASTRSRDRWTPLHGWRPRRRDGSRSRSREADRQSFSEGLGLVSPNHEQEDRDLALALHLQEDRDLALALHLQEEDDEQTRTAETRRLRESQLSEQYIEQQVLDQPSSLTPAARSTTTTPWSNNTPARRPGGSSATTIILPFSGPDANTSRPAQEGADDAPPTYEQAAKISAFEPPLGHPSHAASSASPGVESSPNVGHTQAQQSIPGLAQALREGLQPHRLVSAQAPPYVSPSGHSANSLRSPSIYSSRGRDKDCIVM